MSRIAIIKKEKCHPQRCGGWYCIKVCPVNRTGKDCITKGEDNKAAIDEELCIGCGICTKRCPFDAIRIINLPEVLKETPVFRYARNAFELFRLPIPEKGKVVGLLGANGIGKTTALEIIAGLEKPNLGNYEEKLNEKEIIKHFRGTELQNYFTKLYGGELDISYKPQYIDQLPKQFPKRKVVELLGKLGKEEEIKKITDKLGITQILDRKLSELAGGELQKVAISAAMLKKAQVYLFDEPASYLDVKERVKIASIIRELAKESAVIVVEHDLIILDYLTDDVHILFGKTASYGVVSHPLSSKNGINAYLAGFLKDENMRFRDAEIKFDAQALQREKLSDPFIDWPAMKKKLGTFELEIEPGEIFDKEIIGIVGANSIGKTTFMKMLAGEIKPDKEKLDHKITISYKPQYIKTKEGVTVMAALLGINKEAMSQSNKLDIYKPLQIEHLMDKDISKLSGGELQRVSIAFSLLREADLYLFDEPSNYLDVEQRLAAARVIQKVIKDREAAAVVIDHDLLFATYLSDRILNFGGTPGKAGTAKEIKDVKKGMNEFLKELNITLRKDPESGRPRVNKPESVKDREQRQANKFYL